MGRIDFDDLSGSLASSTALITDITDRDAYLHDATEERGTPLAIVFAECEDDIVATVDFCRRHNLPLVARGAGTGLSGGCVPIDGGLVISTERMKGLRIDARQRTAVCGPGLITKQLVDAATEYGLTYPPDPASYDESTLGGNVAEGAGGLRCKRFGVTKDYVIGLRAVTADGRILKTGIFCDHQAFGLGDLLIASEGTLAVISEIGVRLIETPAIGTTILAAYGSPEDAAQTVSDITRTGIVPTVLEYIDGDAAACSNEYEKADWLDDRVAAILLIETRRLGEDTEKVKHLCRENRCVYLHVEENAAKADRLWTVRRNVSKAMKALAKYRVSEDVAVPNSRFPVLVAFVAEMNRRSPLRINAYGHAGDGNLHVNFMSMTGSDTELVAMEPEIERLLKRAVELGGTLTGEHGIGLAKRKYLPYEFGVATLDYMKRVKRLFDPANIFNPGKIFPTV
jgi:glycolate oxidase